MIIPLDIYMHITSHVILNGDDVSYDDCCVQCTAYNIN